MGLNVATDLIIREILTVVQIKNNLKKSTTPSPTLASSQVRVKVRSSSSLNINVPKINIPTNDDESQSQQLQQKHQQQQPILSAPAQTYLRTHRKTLRLKPNNILIEQDNEQQPVDSTDEMNPTASTLATSNNVTASSFDSRVLQSEIENLKKMRQNYGPDWLLSMPNLIERDDSKKQQVPQQVVRPKLSNAEMPSASLSSKLDEMSVIESFAVYRSVEIAILDLTVSEDVKKFSAAESVDEENGGEGEVEDEGRTLCILSLNETYLIEKDEANSSLLCVNEFVQLSEIMIMMSLNDQQEGGYNIRNQNKVKIKFKDNVFARIYEFENTEEFNVSLKQKFIIKMVYFIDDVPSINLYRIVTLGLKILIFLVNMAKVLNN